MVGLELQVACSWFTAGIAEAKLGKKDDTEEDSVEAKVMYAVVVEEGMRERVGEALEVSLGEPEDSSEDVFKRLTIPPLTGAR